jgi:tetratricopeptide (TPR) repeat protein
LLLPFVTGWGSWDLLRRREPNLEEGNRLLHAGRADAALRAYDRAVAAAPDEPIAHFDRGVALYELGRAAEANQEFLRASEAHDAQLRADAYYNSGNALLKQDRFAEAAEAYKRTLNLRPEDRRAKWNLELALRQLRAQKEPPASPPPAASRQSQKQKQEQKMQSQDQPPPPNRSPEAQPANELARAPDPQARIDREPADEMDKQAAEAVLDALERVEPTVQKDLVRRRAGARQTTKDW